MRKSLWGNGLVVGLICLFISTSVIHGTEHIAIERCTLPIDNIGGNVLYVGGTGPGNYSKIQDAVDNASDGDIIFVYSGTYYEHVNVDKSIRLVGEDKNTTIIDGGGSGNVIKIIKNHVEIMNFTVTNGAYGFWIFSSGNIIIKNIIRNNIDGIWLQSSGNNSIIGNIVSDSIYDGIVLYRSSNGNTIEGNKVQKSGYDGIILYSSSDNNTIKGNTAQNNTYYGIVLDSSNSNTIIENTVQYNNYYGIILNSSNNNVIKHNNFINNRRHAFFMKWNVIPSFNLWHENYWDDWPLMIPRPIRGRMRGLPWINIDWHPAQEPYEM